MTTATTISASLQRALNRNDFNLPDALLFSEEKLREMPGFGAQTINELREHRLEHPFISAQVEPEMALPIHDRLQIVREAVTYIKRTELGGNAPYKSAVSHDAIIEKVRPHLVAQKIAWHPIDIEILGRDEVISKQGNRSIWTQAKVTIRFYCTDLPNEHIDIPVIAEGLDNQDKGSAKLMTYADKSALMWLFNIQRGDDPDFDRLAPGSGADDEITERVNRVRTLYENHPDFSEKPQAGIQGYLVRLARSRGRFRIPTMYDLTEDQLDQWIVELENEAQQHGGSTDASNESTDQAGQI